jgi:zinc protease
MQEEPITADELSKAQSLTLREIQLAESSADSIALGLIYRATHDLPLDEPVVAARRFLKITPQDIRAAFSKWLRVGDMVQVTQGPFPK